MPEHFACSRMVGVLKSECISTAHPASAARNKNKRGGGGNGSAAVQSGSKIDWARRGKEFCFVWNRGEDCPDPCKDGRKHALRTKGRARVREVAWRPVGTRVPRGSSTSEAAEYPADLCAAYAQAVAETLALDTSLGRS